MKPRILTFAATDTTSVRLWLVLLEASNTYQTQIECSLSHVAAFGYTSGSAT